MISVIGDLWEGYIPGEPAGHTMSFFVKAFDMEGAIGFGASHQYRTVDLSNAYYQIDTFATCPTHTDISATGTAIDTSKFFDEDCNIQCER